MPKIDTKVTFKKLPEPDSKVHEISELIQGEYEVLQSFILDRVLYLKLATHGIFNLQGKTVRLTLEASKQNSLYGCDTAYDKDVEEEFYVEQEFCESHKIMYSGTIGDESRTEQTKYGNLRVSLFKLVLSTGRRCND